MHGNNNGYSIIHDFLTLAECQQLKELGVSMLADSSTWQDINFHQGSHNRTQRAIYWNGLRNKRRCPVNAVTEAILKPLVEDILLKGSGYGMETSWVTCSFLHSRKSCPAQVVHRDDVELSSANKRMKKFRSMSFNIIVAFEGNTRLLTPNRRRNMSETREICLPVGAAVVFRGDFPHAGAEYLDADNTRLFIATGTADFINDGYDVFLEINGWMWCRGSCSC